MEDFTKLLEVQHKLNAPKDKKNTFGGYNYRSCEGILEAVKPLLKEQGLVLTISDEIVAVGSRIYVKATAKVFVLNGNLVAECTAYAREEESKKGMDAAQLTGATSSYARKYALNGLFAIDDSKDADTDEYQKEQQQRLATGAQSGQSKATAQPKQEKPSDGKKTASMTAEQQELYSQLCSDIDSCDSVSCVIANVSMAEGQPFEDKIRKIAAKKGIGLARNIEEINSAYELIKDREGWQEVKSLALQTVNEKNLKHEVPAGN